MMAQRHHMPSTKEKVTNEMEMMIAVVVIRVWVTALGGQGAGSPNRITQTWSIYMQLHAVVQSERAVVKTLP